MEHIWIDLRLTKICTASTVFSSPWSRSTRDALCKNVPNLRLTWRRYWYWGSVGSVRAKPDFMGRVVAIISGISSLRAVKYFRYNAADWSRLTLYHWLRLPPFYLRESCTLSIELEYQQMHFALEWGVYIALRKDENDDRTKALPAKITPPDRIPDNAYKEFDVSQ